MPWFDGGLLLGGLRFGADGKVIFHQDYFDAGAFLYEKILILGREIRWIKSRL
jgi:hypothetical protein